MSWDSPLIRPIGDPAARRSPAPSGPDRRPPHRTPAGLAGASTLALRLRYRDYAHGNKTKAMRLPAEEFIRRFPPCPPQRLHAHPALRHRAPRRLPGRARRWIRGLQMAERDAPETFRILDRRLASLTVTAVTHPSETVRASAAAKSVAAIVPATSSMRPMLISAISRCQAGSGKARGDYQVGERDALFEEPGRSDGRRRATGPL